MQTHAEPKTPKLETPEAEEAFWAAKEAEADLTWIHPALLGSLDTYAARNPWGYRTRVQVLTVALREFLQRDF